MGQVPSGLAARVAANARRLVERFNPFSADPYELPRAGRIRRDRLAQDLEHAVRLAGDERARAAGVPELRARLAGPRVLWSDLLAAETAVLALSDGPRLLRRAADLQAQSRRFLGEAAWKASLGGASDRIEAMLADPQAWAANASDPAARAAIERIRTDAESAAGRVYDLCADLHERDERRSTLTSYAAWLILAVMVGMLLAAMADYRRVVAGDGFTPARVVLATTLPADAGTAVKGASAAGGAATAGGTATPGGTTAAAGETRARDAARPLGGAVVVEETPAVYDRGSDALPMILAVLAAGGVGGFVSFQRRLQTAAAAAAARAEWSDDARSFAELLGLGHALAPVLLALTSGALFAVVINVVFATSWISGALFPRILTAGGEASSSFIGWIVNTVVPGDDVPELLLWSFIAGFAERLVPDMLDAIASRAGPTPPK